MDTDSTEGRPTTTDDGDPAAAPPGGDEPFTEEAEDTMSDDEVDEMSKQTFPTSDPPSTWAGADPG